MRIGDRVLIALIIVQVIVTILVAMQVICVVAHADTIPPIADDRSAVLMLHACNIEGCGDIIPPQDDASMPECLSTSQAVAAAWAASHPEWTVRAIWCSGATP